MKHRPAPKNRIRAALCCLVAACFLAGCSGGGAQSSSVPEPEYVGGSTKRDPVASDEVQYTYPGADSVFADIETSRGTIRVVLYPEYAPLAVENFCTLAEMGYYDGTDFHRVVQGFAIQGGDATGTGKGGHSIWGSPLLTERTDALHHFSGALCLAGADGEPDTHLSQFYIVATAQDALDEAALARLTAAGYRDSVVETYGAAGGAPYLDNTDTVFGQVVEGMDVVDKIAAVATDENGKPNTAVTVLSVKLTGWPPQGWDYVIEQNAPAQDPPPEDLSAPAGEDGGGEDAA